MATSPAEHTPHATDAGQEATTDRRATPTPADAGAASTSPARASATAELLTVSLIDVRRVGPETAVVWAAIQSGHTTYPALSVATGLGRHAVRACWAHLARAGYPLPGAS